MVTDVRLSADSGHEGTKNVARPARFERATLLRRSRGYAVGSSLRGALSSRSELIWTVEAR